MAANAQSVTIFIVDDDVGLLRLMQKTLRREGFAVDVAASGKEAISWLSRNTADLMLLDLKLQDIEGKELMNQLAGIQCAIPFVIITGQGDERVAVEMMKRGALDYLVKDVDFLQFLPQVVRRAMDRLSKDKRLEQLQRQVLEVSELEQRRIGQDLHDGLGQQLTAIELMCEALKSNSKVVSNRRELEKELDRLSHYIRSAIAQTRSLARGLIPFKVESGGLEMALTELARSTTSPGRMECRFSCPSPVPLNDPEAATHLYRIAQEAVNNALKHGRASRIEITLSIKDEMLCLEICDNGKGFADSQKEGVGLGVMNHRASTIGAELLIKSTPGKGVTIACLLPLGRKNTSVAGRNHSLDSSRAPAGSESPNPAARLDSQNARKRQQN